MISALVRARVAGGVLALAAFALGVAAGVWISTRERPGVHITVTATDEMPHELKRLGLSATQDSAVHEALMRGRGRVASVMDAIQGRMESAADSTDQEIRALLTDGQRASFDSARRVNGSPIRRKRVIVTR